MRSRVAESTKAKNGMNIRCTEMKQGFKEFD